MKFFFLILLTIFLIKLPISGKTNDKLTWETWKKNIKLELKKNDVSVSTLNLVDSLILNQKVINLDKNQPENIITFENYLEKVVSNTRIKEGVNNYYKNKKLINQIASKYEISPFVLISLWGIETSYGKITGNFDVLNSLASLAFDGRRSSFFNKELIVLLKLIDKNIVVKEKLKGSWAGAIGQTQFMPSTLENFAQDYNNDGNIDLLNSKEDALASGANYLSKLGWNKNIYWGEEIDSVNIDKNLKDFHEKKRFKKVSFWVNQGIKLYKIYDSNSKLRLIIPKSKNKKIYLVSKNFDIILNWNRSNYFALSVNILADEIEKRVYGK